MVFVTTYIPRIPRSPPSQLPFREALSLPGRSPARSLTSTVNSLFDEHLHAYGLTIREKHVTVLVLRGLSNKEIAAECQISELTVKDHLKHIYQKTGAHQRTALLALLLGTNGS